MELRYSHHVVILEKTHKTGTSFKALASKKVAK